MRIAIGEDEALLRQGLTHLLKVAGHHETTADSSGRSYPSAEKVWEPLS